MPRKKREAWETHPEGERFCTFVRGLGGSHEFLDENVYLRPFQEGPMRRLLGTRLRDGRRQYQTFFMALPRKNGKTSLLAWFVLYLLSVEGKKGQHIVCVAASHKQAGYLFDAMVNAIRLSPALQERLEIYYGTRRIVDPVLGNTFEALASEVSSKKNTKVGGNISVAIFDEGAFWENTYLHDAITSSMGTRKEPLIVYISTAGFNPNGWYKRLWDHALRVKADPSIDPTFLPVIYAAAPEDDPWSEETWFKANPALGDFNRIENMRAECEKLKHFPEGQAKFKVWYLNLWQTGENKWIDPEMWSRCEDAFTWEEMIGRKCYAGLDLAPVRDLSSLTLAFPMEDGTIRVLNKSWCPGDDIAARSHKDKVPYEYWRSKGYLAEVGKKTTDFEAIGDEILSLKEKYNIVSIGVDKAYANELGNRLENNGMKVFEYPQTFMGFSPPCKYLERLLLEQEIRHDGNPLLAWCLGNLIVRRNANDDIRPDKEKSTERIDAAVSMLMSLGLVLEFEGEKKKRTGYNPFAHGKAPIYLPITQKQEEDH